MKKVLVFNGSKAQLPLINKLLNSGYDVSVISYYKDSPAFEMVENAAVANMADWQECLKIARSFSPDALITAETDIVVPTMAYVAEKLDLPGIGVEMAQLFTNKYYMRDYCKKNGFVYPQYYLCTDKTAALKAYDDFGSKMIIKPVNAYGSRGVFTIETKEDIQKYFDYSSRSSIGNNNVVLEEYIDGPEFTVDGIKTQAGHTSLAISKKDHYDQAENVANSLIFTNYCKEYDYLVLADYNNRIIENTGLEFGLTHVEYKYHDGQYYLIEMAARGGGTGISTLIEPWVSGVDVYDYLIHMSLGENINRKVSSDKSCNERCATLNFLDIPHEGTIINIHGVDTMKRYQQICNWLIRPMVGDKVKYAQDDADRVGFYTVLADSYIELENIVNDIKNNVWVEVE